MVKPVSSPTKILRITFIVAGGLLIVLFINYETMKKLFMILLFVVPAFFMPVELLAPAAGKFITIVQSSAIRPYDNIARAVRWWETRDRDTINYEEGAHGRYQIRQCKLDEYNKATGNHYRLQDCMEEKVSSRIFFWHMMQYNDTDTAIKRWNGSGPLTVIYLRNIKQILKNQS
jgi:hypothetical protein